MSPVRLGAVGYLNARPHVYGLDRDPRFTVRFDVPSRCAELLHAGEVDLGLIPSIEYLRGEYAIVPDVAIASRGAVASVAIYTKKPIEDVRSLALDTSSRTSVALARVLCSRVFGIAPALVPRGPDLDAMLAEHDAALMIGDNALLRGAGPVRLKPAAASVSVIDLGTAWFEATGLPFVYAFWAGRPSALDAGDVLRLQRARDQGVRHIEEIARGYFTSPAEQSIGARYLRDNIKYQLRAEEQAGLELFYTYAVEAGVMPHSRPLQFFQ